MNLNKAIHKAATKSLDGHFRFVAYYDNSIMVLQIGDLVSMPKADIQVAYFCGKAIKPGKSK